MDTIYVSASQIPEFLRTGSLRTYKIVLANIVDVPAGNGTWDGGSKDTYSVMRLSDSDRPVATAKRIEAAGQFVINPGFVVVHQSIMHGKNMGTTIYARRSEIAKSLPAIDIEQQLSRDMRLVLTSMTMFKSSHNGMDRYEMALRECDGLPGFPSRVDWADTLVQLQAVGFVNLRGGITLKGKNAVEAQRDFSVRSIMKGAAK